MTLVSIQLEKTSKNKHITIILVYTLLHQQAIIKLVDQDIKRFFLKVKIFCIMIFNKTILENTDKNFIFSTNSDIPEFVRK